MAVLINVEVILRYLFNSSTLIADEYSGYLFVWMTLLTTFRALSVNPYMNIGLGALFARHGSVLHSSYSHGTGPETDAQFAREDIILTARIGCAV